jgi:hypothetical protein
VTAFWPCSHCGAPGVRNIGTQGHCAWHLAALLERFDPAAHTHGFGLPDGTAEHDRLRCVRCAATWHGATGETCWWCQRTDEAQRHHQAELILRAPEVDRADENWLPRMGAWVERLKRAVRDGIITDAQARAAVRKEDREAA